MSSLSELNVPGPTVSALTEPFWAAAREGKLLIQRCRACGRAVFYPRGLCPHCWAEALDWEEASGAGRLRSFSLVRKPGHPGWTRAAPYMVGLVETAGRTDDVEPSSDGQSGCRCRQFPALCSDGYRRTHLALFRMRTAANGANHDGECQRRLDRRRQGETEGWRYGRTQPDHVYAGHHFLHGNDRRPESCPL